MTKTKIYFVIYFFTAQGHRGPGGLYTCIIWGGQGFESSRRRLLHFFWRVTSLIWCFGVWRFGTRIRHSLRIDEKRRRRGRKDVRKRARNARQKVLDESIAEMEVRFEAKIWKGTSYELRERRASVQNDMERILQDSHGTI